MYTYVYICMYISVFVYVELHVRKNHDNAELDC